TVAGPAANESPTARHITPTVPAPWGPSVSEIRYRVMYSNGTVAYTISGTYSPSAVLNWDFYSDDPAYGDRFISGQLNGGTPDSPIWGDWSVPVLAIHWDTTPTTTTTPPTTTSSTPPPSKEYAALGDSYSSGEGSGNYLPGTDSASALNSCHRSPQAYGPLLAASGKFGDLKFVACSGAVTDDFFVANPANLNEPPQLNVLGPNTQTVTLTIGGNDAGFVHILNKCVDGPRPSGAPQQDKGGYGCSRNQVLRRDTNARLLALAGAPNGSLTVGRPIYGLADVYREIHRKAPNAKIYVGGYPRLFGPSARNYPREKGAPGGQACTVGQLHKGPLTINFRVDYFDAVWLDDLGNRLNGTIQQAVSSAQGSGVPITYVPPSTFNGHGLCDSGQSWFNGLVFTAGSDTPSAGSFHPTVTGQSDGYAAAFASKTR
ncbi:MAG TPA: SGNH/GDSL hydrolase family protein, partial [Candidatus Saccharimonadia bacterium]